MRGTAGKTALAVLVSTALGFGVAPPALAQSPTSDEKVILRVGVDSDITSLNPFNVCCGPDYEYLSLVYDQPMTFATNDLSPAPALVTEWTPSEDYMTWTLKVRDDAVWHDGQPVTAEDVAFTLGFIADYGMPFFKDYVPFSPTFEVVDPTTVLWKSTKPTFAPNVPPYLPILPKHIWERFTTVSDDPKEVRKAAKEFRNESPIGSGPFELAEWEKGQFIRFEANPNYWGGQPKSLDEVVIQIFSNQEAMAQALRSGEIDFADSLKPTLWNALTGDPNIATHLADGGCWGNFAFNFGGQGKQETHHPAIEDLTVRQAAVHAVDKQEIVDKVYLGTSVVGDSILMPGQNGYWYHDIPDDIELKYDPALANQMLDEAGYLDSDGDGVREMPDGTDPLVWEVMAVTDVDGSVDTTKLLKSYWKDIGISTKVTTVNTNKAYDLWFTGEWDVYVWDWCPDPDPDFMLSVFTTDQCLGWSDGCYSDPKFDAMYEEQRSTLDREERKAIVDEMQEYIHVQAVTPVLNYWSDLQAYRTDRFTGYVKKPDVDNGLLLFSWDTKETYMNLVPVAGAKEAAQPGLPVWVWGAIVGGIVVAAGLLLALRGRRGKEEQV
jgi:peptide/nickel transport system substrate-binding protein